MIWFLQTVAIGTAVTLGINGAVWLARRALMR